MFKQIESVIKEHAIDLRDAGLTREEALDELSIDFGGYVELESIVRDVFRKRVR